MFEIVNRDLAWRSRVSNINYSHVFNIVYSSVFKHDLEVSNIAYNNIFGIAYKEPEDLESLTYSL